MDYNDMQRLKKLLTPQNDSSDSEDDLPKTSLVQLSKYYHIYIYISVCFNMLMFI